MTLEEYASEVAEELAARNASIPFDAVLLVERKTWPPEGPKISPRETVDVWFRTRVVVSMTADEWEMATDPEPMLLRVRFHVRSERFTRFACACCRRIWDLIPGDSVRRIVEATEELLDGALGSEKREGLFDVLDETRLESLSGPARRAAEAVGDLFEGGLDSALAASICAAEARAGGKSEGPAYTSERTAQAVLLRELIGDPLRNL